MPGVLGSDDLDYLTLYRSSIKCLNLNPIMTGVLGPDDLGLLTLILSFFKYLNLSLSILFKVTVRISYIYCYYLKLPFGLVIFGLN